MPRGRKPNLEPSVSWHLHIRQSIAAPVEILLADPVLGKVKAGARQALIESLLEEWLNKRRKQS